MKNHHILFISIAGILLLVFCSCSTLLEIDTSDAYKYYTIALDPVNNYIAASTFLSNLDVGVKIWDLKQGNIMYSLGGYKGVVYSLTFDPQGEYLASASQDSSVKVWDVKTGTLVHDLKGHEGPVYSVAIDRTSEMIASGGKDKKIRLWNLEDGSLLNILEGHTKDVIILVFHNKAGILVSGSLDNTIKVWNIKTGALLTTLTGHEGCIAGLTLDKEGKQIISGSCDKTIKIWDWRTGKVLRTLTGHTSTVSRVEIDPGRTRLFSSGFDNKIGVWDLARGDFIQWLYGHSDATDGFVIDPKGYYFITASVDKKLIIWSLKDYRKLLTLYTYPSAGIIKTDSETEYILGRGNYTDHVKYSKKDYNETAVLAALNVEPITVLPDDDEVDTRLGEDDLVFAEHRDPHNAEKSIKLTDNYGVLVFKELLDTSKNILYSKVLMNSDIVCDGIITSGDFGICVTINEVVSGEKGDEKKLKSMYYSDSQFPLPLIGQISCEFNKQQHTQGIIEFNKGNYSYSFDKFTDDNFKPLKKTEYNEGYELKLTSNKFVIRHDFPFMAPFFIKKEGRIDNVLCINLDLPKSPAFRENCSIVREIRADGTYSIRLDSNDPALGDIIAIDYDKNGWITHISMDFNLYSLKETDR
ncbi:MAG: WD40 repeat domain-containing protein [Spirochaetales bacterium]|nr:WD40 repeat domain-containing protein [Spirochaetales bacterium]